MTNKNSTNLSRSTLRLSLAVALAATLGACEDVPPPAPRTRASVVESQPTPVTPPPAVTPPPPPLATPEVKPEPVDDKPVDALTAARKMLDEGEVEKALELAKVAVREMPKRSAAWNVLGRAELRGGKRQDAIESFEKAIEVNPTNPYAHNNLGLALIYDKQFDRAVDALEEAVELAPVAPYMWNNLGMAYEQLDRLDDARDAYAKAAAMESERARDSLTRLKGVESVIRTAKVEPDAKPVPGALEETPETKTKEPQTTTQ